MIIGIDMQTLDKIKNPALRDYAGLYVEIYADFLNQISEFGLEIDPLDFQSESDNTIEGLRLKGAIFRNDSKSIYTNAISPSCVACQKGIGSATYFVSLQCHRDCFYCFNPNQEGHEYFIQNKVDPTGELQRLAADGQKVDHIALTGGEPLLHEEETIT